MISGGNSKEKPQFDSRLKTTTSYTITFTFTDFYTDASRPASCLDILNQGSNESGMYIVWYMGRQLRVLCDMDTDGGGWTLVYAYNSKFP